MSQLIVNVFINILLLSRLRQIVGFSFPGLFGPDSPKASDGACLTDSIEGLELLEVVCDLHGAGSAYDLLNGHDLADQLAGLLHVLLAGLTLPGLLGVDGEQDQLGLVLL